MTHDVTRSISSRMERKRVVVPGRRAQRELRSSRAEGLSFVRERERATS